MKLAPFRTNTFATCRHVLEGAGFGDETVAVNRRAVELAREARDRVAPDRAVAVAGSMSNTVAWLPGTVGPDFAHLPSPEQEAANYREMADILAEAGCDLLVMEMMMDVERAMRVTEAALATGLPVWVGISTSPGSRSEQWRPEPRPLASLRGQRNRSCCPARTTGSAHG